MSDAPRAEPTGQALRPLRIWPLWCTAALLTVTTAISLTPSISNFVRSLMLLFGPLAGLVLLLVWLFALSRLTWLECLDLFGAMLVLAVVFFLLVQPQVRFGLYVYGVILWVFALSAVLTIAARRAPRRRTAAAAAAMAAVWLWFPLVRVNGYDGQYLPDLAWRWNPTSEEQLLASGRRPTLEVGSDWDAADAPWPGFRGAERNSRARIEGEPLDWREAAPREVWRIAVGPGWSSFALVSNRLYTQEQLGDDEAVTCYDARTGTLLWQHLTPARFSEIIAGPGPRATPTYADGRIYALGSKAHLTCLDAQTGELVWQRDLLQDRSGVIPEWGFSGSPLVIGDRAIVDVGGESDYGLVGFDAESGALAWHVRSNGDIYSSPQSVVFDGQTMALVADEDGLWAVEPDSGATLWKFRPTNWEGRTIVQPQQIGPTSLIVALGDAVGAARIEVEHDPDGAWRVAERWNSRNLKASFNDYVFHDGFLYGFDKNIFACVDAESGERRWKRGRYGFGQVLLLAELEQMIVVAEDGRAVLLACNPDELEELGEFAPLEGKTWNHPIVVDDRLYLRNGTTAACFELR